MYSIKKISNISKYVLSRYIYNSNNWKLNKFIIKGKKGRTRLVNPPVYTIYIYTHAHAGWKENRFPIRLRDKCMLLLYVIRTPPPTGLLVFRRTDYRYVLHLHNIIYKHDDSPNTHTLIFTLIIKFLRTSIYGILMYTYLRIMFLNN